MSGVAARVIDAYSVKPIDAATLTEAAQETGLLIVVENHYLKGGLGEAVASDIGTLCPICRLAVTMHPRSGKKAAARAARDRRPRDRASSA